MCCTFIVRPTKYSNIVARNNVPQGEGAQEIDTKRAPEKKENEFSHNVIVDITGVYRI